MILLANSILILLLLTVMIQDFKWRQITAYLLPLLFVTFFVRALLCVEFEYSTLYTAINAGFIGVQLLFLTLYMSIKKRQLVNIIDSHLGLGDVLFFIAISPAFTPFNFIVFYTGSLILSLFAYGGYLMLMKNANKHIPLAGLFAAMMIVFIVMSIVFPRIDFYGDDIIRFLSIN